MKHTEAIMVELKEQAMRAAGYSHTPYSHFRVGAAVIGQSEKIYRGCNVENASFSLTQCAERSALTAAISDGAAPGSLTTLLIYTPGDTAHPPCGACRQVMHELMAADSLVISCCDGDERRTWTRSEYLPDPFVPDALLK
ncbi:cytidine deaminase [Pseudomonadota bacterium]